MDGALSRGIRRRRALFFLNDIGTSLVATGVVVVVPEAAPRPDGRRRWRDPAPMAMFAALLGSAVLSCAYARAKS